MSHCELDAAQFALVVTHSCLSDGTETTAETVNYRDFHHCRSVLTRFLCMLMSISISVHANLSLHAGETHQKAVRKNTAELDG